MSGVPMVPLIPNSGQEYAAQATERQRALLAQLCEEHGLDPELLPVRSKSKAKLLIGAFLGTGPMERFAVRDKGGRTIWIPDDLPRIKGRAA